MDKMTTFSCPSCGAQFEVPLKTREVTCKYCGGAHALLDLKHVQAPAQNINPDKTKENLMLFFGFSVNDLEYNRKGILSPHQKKQFSDSSLESFLKAITLGIVSILFIFIFMGGRFQQVLLCWGIVVTLSLVIGLINYKKGMRPVKAGVVQQEIGVVHKTKEQKVFIGHFPFPNDDKRYMFLEPGVLYKVYYSPIGNSILSIELANP